jgi:hypothetical protein
MWRSLLLVLLASTLAVAQESPEEEYYVYPEEGETFGVSPVAPPPCPCFSQDEIDAVAAACGGTLGFTCDDQSDPSYLFYSCDPGGFGAPVSIIGTYWTRDSSNQCFRNDIYGKVPRQGKYARGDDTQIAECVQIIDDNCVIQTSDLVAYWKTPTTTTNSRVTTLPNAVGTKCGAACDASPSPVAPWVVGGPVEEGPLWTGAAGEYATVSDNAELSNGGQDMSLCIWVQSYSSSSSRLWAGKFLGDFSGQFEYRLADGGGQSVSFIAHGGCAAGNSSNANSGASAWSSNEPFLACGVYNSTTKIAGVSVNGGTPTYGSAHTSTMCDGTAPFFVGGTDIGSNADDRLGPLVIYMGTELSNANLTSLYNGGEIWNCSNLPVAGATNCWDMTGPSTWNDSIGTSDLTVNGGVAEQTYSLAEGSFGETGIGTQTLGGNQALTIPHTSYLSPGDGQDFFISCWTLLDDYQSEAKYMIAKFQGGKAEWQLQRAVTGGGRVSFSVYDGTFNQVGFAQVAGGFVLHQWFNSMAWIDATAGKVYAAYNNGTPAEGTITGTIGTNDAPITIGTGFGTGYWKGAIDECLVMDRVPTADERTQLYTTGPQ